MRATACCEGVLVLFLLFKLAAYRNICTAYTTCMRRCPHSLASHRIPSSTAANSCFSFGGRSADTHRKYCNFWSSLGSRTSIETVIHTGDCEDYDVNCVQYRKARFWRELSTPEIEEEIRKVRKVLAKINLYRKTKNPALRASSLGNTRRTLAQLLFIRHERHLASLREAQGLKKHVAVSGSSDETSNGHG
ncbi:ribosomal protein L29, putative [Babesia bigemina]|uniref:Ribosomal protein L29, putative n=1 Tax=Babesia bigemina TaxID=5866 RepID=A0A061D530_BABBI|nr:ribosomal protein L29, putative [Babesia bigemina]CDR95673.1 ribosomal protein L29, putative [Babesia bigemina]|eukprot:XP_012767859.1 ribosomal protein L29, putative [Babesia bigemina]